MLFMFTFTFFSCFSQINFHVWFFASFWISIKCKREQYKGRVVVGSTWVGAYCVFFNCNGRPGHAMWPLREMWLSLNVSITGDKADENERIIKNKCFRFSFICCPLKMIYTKINCSWCVCIVWLQWFHVISVSRLLLECTLLCIDIVTCRAH